jgi:hypothetical protein
MPSIEEDRIFAFLKSFCVSGATLSHNRRLEARSHLIGIKDTVMFGSNDGAAED